MGGGDELGPPGRVLSGREVGSANCDMQGINWKEAGVLRGSYRRARQASYHQKSEEAYVDLLGVEFGSSGMGIGHALGSHRFASSHEVALDVIAEAYEVCARAACMQSGSQAGLAYSSVSARPPKAGPHCSLL
jgi:hypothetical protein